jgi:hypothetical protein
VRQPLGVGREPDRTRILHRLRLKRDACEIFQETVNFMRCGACRSFFYCGRDHQTEDRPSHKTLCKGVKTCQDRLNEEEKKLREFQGDELAQGNLFVTEAGHFWLILETRDYMRARLDVVVTLLRSFGGFNGRAAGVEIALNHLRDMLRLCRGDNLGVRDMVPALYIRLGRDQEAYDFCKWYATEGKRSNYDWGDTSLPFLDTKGADPLEDTDLWAGGSWPALSHASSVALIKVRALLDLIAVQRATQGPAGGIHANLVSPITKARPELLTAATEDTAARAAALRKQIGAIYRAVDMYNPHYWPALLKDPGPALVSTPGPYMIGSEPEAFLIVNYNIPAWYETKGAVKLMQEVGAEE